MFLYISWEHCMSNASCLIIAHWSSSSIHLLNCFWCRCPYKGFQKLERCSGWDVPGRTILNSSSVFRSRILVLAHSSFNSIHCDLLRHCLEIFLIIPASFTSYPPKERSSDLARFTLRLFMWTWRDSLAMNRTWLSTSLFIAFQPRMRSFLRCTCLSGSLVLTRLCFSLQTRTSGLRLCPVRGIFAHG